MKLILVIFCNLLWSSELAYVKTDTPRDTMETFIVAMNDYKKGVETNDPQLKSRIDDAIRCFAEKDGAVVVSHREKELAAIFLKEVIDRVVALDFSKIPNETSLPNNRWRLKNSEITLRPVRQGEREGEWLITEGTWKRASKFYHRVKHLPYIEGSGGGALYVQPWMEKFLPEWSKRETLRLKNWQWLGIFLGFIIGLLIKFFFQFFTAILVRFSFHPKLAWKKELVQEIEKPSGLIIAAVFWYFLAINLKLEGFAFGLINGLIQIVFGIGVTWASYKAVTVLARYLRGFAQKTESTLDDQLVPLVEKVLKIFVVLMGVLVILQNLGVNVFSLLAGLGLGGLAFALAAKDTAANLFGSVVILIDRPFKIGDWIKVEGVEGMVEEIGFRSTRIRTFYNSLITVPNANMATAQLDNMGMRAYRRTYTKLDVTYDTKPELMEEFIAGIKEIIANNPHTRKDYYHVAFSDYASASLQVMVYFFIITDDWAVEIRERQAIYMEIYRLAEKLGVEFAFPTQTLYLRNENAERVQ